jgi:hypothetical protein
MCHEQFLLTWSLVQWIQFEQALLARSSDPITSFSVKSFQFYFNTFKPTMSHILSI